MVTKLLGNLGNRLPSCKGGGIPPIECAREIQRDRASEFWRDREREFYEELEHSDLVLVHVLRSYERRNHTEYDTIVPTVHTVRSVLNRPASGWLPS